MAVTGFQAAAFTPGAGAFSLAPASTGQPVAREAPASAPQVEAAPPIAATPVPPPPATQAIPPEAAQPAQAPFAWPEAAVNCPRTWIAGSEAGAAGGEGAACHEFATLPPIAPSPELEAAAEAEAPIAAAEEANIVVARLPLARPADPPKLAEAPKRASRSKQAGNAPRSWPSEPPPDCGSKRARWRYTDRKQGKKAWYCK